VVAARGGIELLQDSQLLQEHQLQLPLVLEVMVPILQHEVLADLILFFQLLHLLVAVVASRLLLLLVQTAALVGVVFIRVPVVQETPLQPHRHKVIMEELELMTMAAVVAEVLDQQGLVRRVH
jgi:hypothetical protein